MLIMTDLNEHSQCHLQGVIRDIEVGIISYSDPALQVITAGHSPAMVSDTKTVSQ